MALGDEQELNQVTEDWTGRMSEWAWYGDTIWEMAARVVASTKHPESHGKAACLRDRLTSKHYQVRIIKWWLDLAQRDHPVLYKQAHVQAQFFEVVIYACPEFRRIATQWMLNDVGVVLPKEWRDKLMNPAS